VNTFLEPKLQATNKLDVLKDRAKMLSSVRSFFSKKDIMEVDCPSLLNFPSVDAHIDLMHTYNSSEKKSYLHTSPEYLMKRLLSQGLSDIYYLGHVFRYNEEGPFHNPEFTMIEWYRQNISFSCFLKETTDLLHLFFGDIPIKKTSYKQLFKSFFSVDIHKDTPLDLYKKIIKKIDLPVIAKEWEKDVLLDLIISHFIQPNLGKDHLLILYDFPPSQAALSKIIEKKGEKVAERFEIYYKGVELANGYHEINESKEIKRRLEKENIKRKKMGKITYPIDDKFLSSLDDIKNDYYGISIGFDRLLMIRHKKDSIEEVLPFSCKQT
jgi:lysyl-tRNA synthetase class 2